MLIILQKSFNILLLQAIKKVRQVLPRQLDAMNVRVPARSDEAQQMVNNKQGKSSKERRLTIREAEPIDRAQGVVRESNLHHLLEFVHLVIEHLQIRVLPG